MNLTRTFILGCALLARAATYTYAAAGDVDHSFEPGSALNGMIQAITAQGEDHVLIGGQFTVLHGAMRSGLARLNADGSVDGSFIGQVTGAPVDGPASVSAIRVQSDGKLLIGGDFAYVNGITRSNLARLDANGSLDASFPVGAGPDGPVSDVLLQTDGKIIIAGSFSSPRPLLARLNPDGSLDSTFLATFDGPYLQCLSLQSDGKLLIGGAFTSVNGVARTNLARLNADGSLDTSFLNGLSGPEGYGVSGLSIQSDGRVLIVGLFQTVNGVTRTNLARLNPDGSLDLTYSARLETCGSPAILPVLLHQLDGKLLVGGGFCSINGISRTNLARINADGTLDEAFLPMLPSIAVRDGGLSSFCLQPDGKLVVSGGMYFMPAVPGKYLSRLNADGSLDDTFNPGPSGPNALVRRVAIQPDGRTLIAGDFTSVSGVPCGHVARLMPDGSLDTAFLTGLSGANGNVYALALQSDGRIVLGGGFSSVNGVTRQGIARINPDGSLDTLSNNVPGYIYALALDANQKIVIGGSFTLVGNGARANLARLNQNGSVDSSFLPLTFGTGLNQVSDLVIQPDGKLVLAGFFSTINGTSRNRIARINTNGSLDTTFLSGMTGMDQAVWSVAVQPDGKVLAGGWFTTVNGVARNDLVRLNVNGSVDTSFNPALGQSYVFAKCLKVQSDGRILLGGAFSTDLANNHCLLRLKADGSLDEVLASPALLNEAVESFAFESNGRMVICGSFTAVNQTPRSFVARLLGTYSPPAIVKQPQSQTAESGSSVQLSVRASGSSPLAYQWLFNDVAISSATKSFLQFPAVQLPDSGAYVVIVTNDVAAVTSSPAMLNVIAPVERRDVPGIQLTAAPGSVLSLDYRENLELGSVWTSLGTVTMTSGSEFYPDLSQPLPRQRFYRTSQAALAAPPRLDLLGMVPAITVRGEPGKSVRVDGIYALGPTDAWFTLGTVTLASSPQLYFDIAAPFQPLRLYRLVPAP